MRHRSVSAAARELGLTSSATSHALGRLRKILRDELFVPGKSGMEPTPRALEMAPHARNGVNLLLSALESSPFRAENSTRTFTIAATDYTATAWIPHLVARLVRKAPKIALRVLPAGRLDTVRLLDDGRIDLILGWFNVVPNRMSRAVIIQEKETLLVRAGHPLTQGRLTKDRLMAFGHVVVEVTGTEDRGVDGFTDERGVTRRTWVERLLIEANGPRGLRDTVFITVPSYGPVPYILAATDLVATMPLRLAQQAVQGGTVVMLELPYKPLEVNVEAIWHERSDADPALQWLIAEIKSIAGDDADG